MKEKNTEPAHSFLLSDVERYGSIEKALIVKEIRGMQIYKLRNGGSGYVYYSSKALSEKFPYMKKDSIKRWLRELVEDEVLETTIQNKVKFDKTLSYRVTHVGQNDPSVGQNDPSEGSKTHLLMGQNDPTIPSHSSHSSHSGDFNKKEPKDYRGLESPAKEKIRQALRTGDFVSLK